MPYNLKCDSYLICRFKVYPYQLGIIMTNHEHCISNKYRVITLIISKYRLKQNNNVQIGNVNS